MAHGDRQEGSASCEARCAKASQRIDSQNAEVLSAGSGDLHGAFATRLALSRAD